MATAAFVPSDSVDVNGFYTVTGPTEVTFYATSNTTPRSEIAAGWTTSDILGLKGNLRVSGVDLNLKMDQRVKTISNSFSESYVWSFSLQSDTDQNPPKYQYTTGIVLYAPEKETIDIKFEPGKFTREIDDDYTEKVYQIEINPKVISGNAAPLRDLNSYLTIDKDVKEPYNPFIEKKGGGFGTGAITALAAIGPQDNYMYGGESKWTPRISQHTPFVITQRLTNPLRNIEGFLGNTVQVDILPRECGDLISNMYLKCSLPALPSGYYYTELIGRAIIKKAEFIVDGEVYESITDDWYIINDQLTLDADEKLGMYQLVSNGTPENTNVSAVSQLNLLVPLEFFFCRRFTHMRENKKPYFPMCALTNSTISVRFTFNKATWITNAPTEIDLIKPQLLIEEITLSPAERMYYRSGPLRFRVPRVWKEAVQPFSGGVSRLNLTADFKVSMMVWFIRNKAYENESSSYYESRYSYGYTTKYIVSATPVTFFNGVQLRYVDTIDYATMYLNNNNILSNFPGGLYYTFKQAIDHGLSIPTKSMYMYCFSEKPLQYNHDGGSLDFSKLNSQTTHLDIKFLEEYASQIQADYSLNLYYYGYVNLEIANGLIRRI
jgi:hypothetical protein